jgi:peptidoglycan/LPS O-acetylase OafA/YrhL
MSEHASPLLFEAISRPQQSLNRTGTRVVAVVLVLKGLPALLPIESWSPWISYPVTLGFILLLTTGISHLSYKYFESYFLRKKARFSTVMSGDLVK